MKTKKSNSNIEVYENLYPFSLSVASINDIEEINNKYYFYNNISDYLNYSNKIENLNPDPSLSGLTALVSDKETEHKSVLIILDLDSVSNNLGILTHESIHYTDALFDSLGLNGEGYDAGDEHYAYLAEWCFNCLLDYVERRKEKWY